MSSVEIRSGLCFLDVHVMQLINVLRTLSEQGWLFGMKGGKLVLYHVSMRNKITFCLGTTVYISL
jgi:hypothetical protein